MEIQPTRRVGIDLHMKPVENWSCYQLQRNSCYHLFYFDVKQWFHCESHFVTKKIRVILRGTKSIQFQFPFSWFLAVAEKKINFLTTVKQVLCSNIVYVECIIFESVATSKYSGDPKTRRVWFSMVDLGPVFEWCRLA